MAVEMLQILGQKIRALRQARGWTQEQLAAAAKITPQYLSKIETGAKPASIITLSKIAAALAMELNIDFDQQKGLEDKKTVEWMVKILSQKSDRQVDIIGKIIELMEEYK